MVINAETQRRREAQRQAFSTSPSALKSTPIEVSQPSPPAFGGGRGATALPERHATCDSRYVAPQTLNLSEGGRGQAIGNRSLNSQPSTLNFSEGVRGQAIGNRNRAKRGAALLLVLWIIGLLGIITVSFAWDAFLEGKVASFERKRSRAESLAQSGIEIAKMLLKKQQSVTGQEDEEETLEDEWYNNALALSRGASMTLTRELGGGTIRLDIEPEQVWRNVNNLKDEDWERLFTNVLGLPEDYWPELIDSFNDWIDTDDMPNENGGETDDYYATLDKPYSAKNGPLDTVRELLLIKGFSEPILTGGVLNPEDPKESWIVVSNGVERLLTVYGDGKINVNAIRPDNISVLLSLPGITEIEANAILEEREQPSSGTYDDDDDTSYKSVEDFMARVGDLLDDNTIQNYITVNSQYFRVTSVGQVDRATRRISAIVYVDGDLFRVLRWSEEP